MKNLYKFYWDLHYGQCEGLFTATPEQIKSVLGKSISFGSLEGKHGDVHGSLEEIDFEILSDDKEFVENFEKIVGNFGFNPLEYVQEEGE